MQELLAASGGVGAKAIHPANVPFGKLFKKLDLDLTGLVTRGEWVTVLRRHVGVGGTVSDEDLLCLFDAMDEDKNGGITLREFAAWARGASTSAMARGISYEKGRR